MKRIFGIGEKYFHFLFFFAFLILYGAVTYNVVLFGDDFYYCTFLSRGFSYFLSENVHHYMQTNGRAFVHLLTELLLVRSSIVLWKIFSVLVIGAIAYFSALIASNAAFEGRKTFKFKISLCISSALIALVSIYTARQTLYWATGFMNYVFPIALTLMLFYFTEKGMENGRFGAFYAVLSFFSCATTEQNAFASLCILICAYLFMLFKKKRPPIGFYIAFALGIIGIISLFAAPGNAVRQTYYPEFYGMSLLERVFGNIEKLKDEIFRYSGASRAIAVFFAVFAFRRDCIRNKMLRTAKRVLNLLSSLLLILDMHVSGMYSVSSVLAIGVFAFDVILLAVYCFSDIESNFVPAFFAFMSAALQGAMLVSPEMGPRTVLVSVMLLTVPTSESVTRSESLMLSLGAMILAFLSMSVISAPFAAAFVLLFAALVLSFALKNTRLKKSAVLLMLALLTLNMMLLTLSGYKENYEVHRENMEYLDDFRAENKNDTGEALMQRYLANSVYKYTMPYDDPYHLYWFKIAMNIPTETKVEYE